MRPTIDGSPTPAEIAAVLALLTRAEPAPDRLAQWRRERIAAVRRTTASPVE